MKLGEKIKAERIRLGLTQNAIAGNFITRNMLSCIESGKVQPSIETLKYLSETLNLPIGYLMDENENLFFYKKEKAIPSIRKAYEQKRYQDCLVLIDALGEMDDEIRFLYVCASFYFGKRLTIAGDLRRAAHHFENCKKHMAGNRQNATHNGVHKTIFQNIKNIFKSRKANGNKNRIN